MLGSEVPKRTRYAVDVLAVLTFIALVVSAWTLATRFQETNHTRSEIQHTWHSVICALENQRVNDPRYTLDQKKEFVTFFDSVLVNNVGAAPCGLQNTWR